MTNQENSQNNYTNFSQEEEALFQKMQQELDLFNKHYPKLPAPQYNKEIFGRFRDWGEDRMLRKVGLRQNKE